MLRLAGRLCWPIPNARRRLRADPATCPQAEGGQKLTTVHRDTQLVDALERMDAEGIFAMGVVNDRGQLVGKLTAMSLKAGCHGPAPSAFPALQ